MMARPAHPARLGARAGFLLVVFRADGPFSPFQPVAAAWAMWATPSLQWSGAPEQVGCQCWRLVARRRANVASGRMTVRTAAAVT